MEDKLCHVLRVVGWLIAAYFAAAALVCLYVFDLVPKSLWELQWKGFVLLLLWFFADFLVFLVKWPFAQFRHKPYKVYDYTPDLEIYDPDKE